MAFFSFLSNGFHCFNRVRTTRDIEFPIEISIKPWYLADVKVINFQPRAGNYEVKIDYVISRLFEVIVCSANDWPGIGIRQGYFPFDRFLQRKMAAHIQFSEAINTTRIYTSAKCSLEVFKDALVLNFDYGEAPCYLIFESGVLGVITDKNFIVRALISWNLSADELRLLNSYAQFELSPDRIEKLLLLKLEAIQWSLARLANDQSEEACRERRLFEQEKIGFERRLKNEEFMVALDPKLELPKGCCMTHSKELIDKMLELKNVDYFELLYLGLKRELITERAVSDFAARCLERDVMADNKLVLELAGLVFDEYKQVTELLESAISDKEKIFAEREPVYNKIWFYLTMVAEMKAENFLD